MDDFSSNNIEFYNYEINLNNSKIKLKNEVSTEKIFFSFYNKSFYITSKHYD